jgi:glycosyltransferase involved in cell wall biosynthesis
VTVIRAAVPACESLRILHLISDLSGGGAERQLSYLAPALARRGHEVHVGYTRSGEFTPNMPGVVLHRLLTRSSYDPRLIREVANLIARVKPDLIQTWILLMDAIGGSAASVKGVPWVLREPSSAMAYHPQTWKHWLRALVARRARAIICNSAGGDEYWRDRLPRSRRLIVRNGLPIAEIDAVPPDVPDSVLQRSVPVVLYVGRLSSDGTATKNLAELLHVFALVREHQPFVGVLCGNGPQREELIALRGNLGLDNDVVLTGELTPQAVWALMKTAAAFVSLSAYEGCPNAVIEAMACGSPLVLSDIPAHREIADDGCAVFVDPRNRQQSAASILRVLRDRDEARARTIAARARAKDWSTDRMVRSYERIYEAVR